MSISGDAEKNFAGVIVAYLSGGSLTAASSQADVSIAAGSNKKTMPAASQATTRAPLSTRP
ncbi:MAG: hypothetical protein GX763_03430 [Clostridiaceae bacterium]|nr:hypothetical protein [Clostridiaceae bacterium]